MTNEFAEKLCVRATGARYHFSKRLKSEKKPRSENRLAGCSACREVKAGSAGTQQQTQSDVRPEQLGGEAG